LQSCRLFYWKIELPGSLHFQFSLEFCLGLFSNRKTIKRNGTGKEICFPQGKTRTGCADRLCANAIGYAKHRSAPHDAVIRVYDAAGKLIEAPARPQYAAGSLAVPAFVAALRRVTRHVRTLPNRPARLDKAFKGELGSKPRLRDSGAVHGAPVGHRLARARRCQRSRLVIPLDQGVNCLSGP
jgi:hypothetical protein